MKISIYQYSKSIFSEIFWQYKAYLIIQAVLLIPVFIQGANKKGDNHPSNLVFESVERAHVEIWRRFVSKQNILYDYTDSFGNVFIPTIDETGKLMPNGLSYQTPIEDGAFYNGIYLDGLCERWKKLKTQKAKKEARAIAAGLIKLATVSDVPGFIARNVLPDGHTHYPASSDDQTFPWFYGMWKYLISGIPDEEESEKIKKLIVEKATALHGYNWDIPCDPLSFGTYGSFSGINYKHLVRIPFITRIVFEVTGDEAWNQRYLQSLKEIPAGEKDTRIDLLSQGIPYDGQGTRKYNFWLSASSQAALKELSSLEKDEAVKHAYLTALKLNALSAVRHMQMYSNFDNDNALTFQVNWRYLNDLWRPQTNSKEARLLGFEQVNLARKISPRAPYEFDFMTEPLFAAWVIVLSNDDELIRSVSPQLKNLLMHYDWSKLNTVTFFISELIYYEGLSNFLTNK